MHIIIFAVGGGSRGGLAIIGSARRSGKESWDAENVLPLWSMNDDATFSIFLRLVVEAVSEELEDEVAVQRTCQ